MDSANYSKSAAETRLEMCTLVFFMNLRLIEEKINKSRNLRTARSTWRLSAAEGSKQCAFTGVQTHLKDGPLIDTDMPLLSWNTDPSGPAHL